MKRILLSFVFCLCVLWVKAQTVVYCSEAGMLSSVVTDLNIGKDTVTDLRISGYIDARDFKELRTYAKLRSLDLAKVTINAYTGMDGPYGEYIDGVPVPIVFAANQVPDRSIGFNLEKFVFPNSVTNIVDQTFYGRSVKEVILPPKLESIGAYAFADCLNLNNIIIPDSLKYLGEFAFRKCTGLTTPVIFPKTLKVIGNAPFIYCSKVPQVTFDKKSPYFVVDEHGVVYSNNLDTLLFFPPYFKGKYRINPNVKTIKEYSVAGVEGLTSLVFSDSLEFLGMWALSGCKNLRWVDFKSPTTFSRYSESVPSCSYAFLQCPLDTIYVSCRQRPANRARTMWWFQRCINTGKLFVPLDSIEQFKNDTIWGQFNHIYGVQTMPLSLDKPEITSFRVHNISTQTTDTTFSTVIFELHGNNILNYNLSSEFVKGGSKQTYAFKNDTSFYTVVNIDRRWDNRFELLGVDDAGNESETKEIIIKADILNSLKFEFAETFTVYSCCKSFLNIDNQSNQTLKMKVYSTLGSCIMESNVLKGQNEYKIINGSGVYIVTVENNRGERVSQKVFVK